MINWIYGSGFPKRKNLLKPAHEPIVVARKGVNKELNLDEQVLFLKKISFNESTTRLINLHLSLFIPYFFYLCLKF